MPGWYIHMDATRKALASLDTNPRAAPIFASGGPTAAQVQAIALGNPTYAALGAIGPDIFFLLPDFKPPVGSMLFGAAHTIKDFYTWWDDNFLGPYEDQLGPIADNLSDEVDAVTGGLANELSTIFSRAFSFLRDFVIDLIVRQYDVFALLGSGVPQGYDEQTFFWSDMLHYRRTMEFGAHLWQKAGADPKLQSFALGWMSHLATDVTGHAFVNEKAGGPYRLHWQRHHVVENHMDAKVYDSEYGGGSNYQMLSCSALHLWLAFNPDGSSREDFFAPQPSPAYATGDKTPDLLDRKSKWDVDSDLPADLATFIAEALSEVFPPGLSATSSKAQTADHPTIIEEYEPGSNGYASADDVTASYWWLYHYVKFTTTDYFKLRRPDPPDVINVPPFPSPPGSGTSDPGPGASDDSTWHDILEILLAILAWLTYLAEVAAWPAAAIVGLITSAGTYPIRELLYENLELPLYNAWAAVHWYLAMTGFVMPMANELNAGLMTLGVGVTDTWAQVWAALDDLSGGLVPIIGTEPSGSDRDRETPHDVVLDPASNVQTFLSFLPTSGCSGPETASEFVRPWLFPTNDNEGDPVGSERTLVRESPYVAMQDPTVLIGGMPGDNTARKDFEAAQSEKDTLVAIANHLPAGRSLGDPVDYIAYLVGLLTRTDPASIANFNLDADRGYGYLAWDWVRSEDPRDLAAPHAYRTAGPGNSPTHVYRAPVAPGAGWCSDDLVPPLGPQPPAMHQPGSDVPVRIRYIDREEKFG